MARQTVQILDRQSLLDIAIQELGTIEGIFALMLDNPDKVDSITASLTPGDRLKVISPVIDPVVLDFYKSNDLHPVSISDNSDIAVGGDYNDDYNNDYFG